MQRNDPDLYGADECNVDYDTAVCSDLIYSNSAQMFFQVYLKHIHISYLRTLHILTYLKKIIWWLEKVCFVSVLKLCVTLITSNRGKMTQIYVSEKLDLGLHEPHEWLIWFCSDAEAALYYALERFDFQSITIRS